MGLTILFSILTFSKMEAQTIYPLTNSLNCDVTIAYELYKSNCSLCSWGTITIPANSTTNLTLCSGNLEICIVIMDIGGSTPAANHSNVIGNCHNMTPYGQTGSGIGVACSSTGSWTATHLAGSWTIN